MNTKRFKYDKKYTGLGESDNIGDLIHQGDLEGVMDSFKNRQQEDIDERYPPTLRTPVITLYYEKDDQEYYEHFCGTNCLGMFRDKAERIQSEIDNGTISNVMTFRSVFDVQYRVPKTKLEDINLD